jgi:hypothetical protein
MSDIIEFHHIDLLQATHNQPNGYQQEKVDHFSMNPVVGRGYGIRLGNIYYNFGAF